MKITLQRAARAGLVAAGLLLSACAPTITAVSGAYAVGDDFSVTLGVPWNDMTGVQYPRNKDVHVLTVDGPLLNRLHLAGGIAPGAGLVVLADKDAPRPLYQADMDDSEIVEFVIDSIATLQFEDPQAENIRPQDFAAAPGMRFDIRTRTAQGLDVAGTALIARDEHEALNVMIFLAPREYYYDTLAPEVESIFASAAAS